MHTFSVQSGYSWYLPTLLCVFCMVRASLQMTTGWALLSSLTEFKQGLWLPAATSTPGAIIASGKSCGRDLTIWHQAKAKSCPLETNYPKANHPKIMGYLWTASNLTTFGEVPSWARFEGWVFQPICVFINLINKITKIWLNENLHAVETLQYIPLRSHLSFSTILEYGQQDFCLN